MDKVWRCEIAGCFWEIMRCPIWLECSGTEAETGGLYSFWSIFLVAGALPVLCSRMTCGRNKMLTGVNGVIMKGSG